VACASTFIGNDTARERSRAVLLLMGVYLMWIQEERLWGCAHLFRPTYAGANVGHPSDFLRPRCETDF
jgi:hypothetical protein